MLTVVGVVGMVGLGLAYSVMHGLSGLPTHQECVASRRALHPFPPGPSIPPIPHFSPSPFILAGIYTPKLTPMVGQISLSKQLTSQVQFRVALCPVLDNPSSLCNSTSLCSHVASIQVTSATPDRVQPRHQPAYAVVDHLSCLAPIPPASSSTHIQ